MENSLQKALKNYSFKQSVLKNHYPFKYWSLNRSLFVNIAFWTWIVWFTLVIFSILVPVNNSRVSSNEKVVVFETAFSFVLKLLGSSNNPSANISPSVWSYEAYFFCYLTIALIILSLYLLIVLKNFFWNIREIVKSLNSFKNEFRVYACKTVIYWLIFISVLLVTWTSFALLYLKKPTDQLIETFIFKKPESITGYSLDDKVYFKPLTITGIVTILLNLFLFFIVVGFYSKYVFENFYGNNLFFKAFKTKVNQKKEIIKDDEVKKRTFESIKTHMKHNGVRAKNRPGYIAELRNVNKYFKVDDGYFHALKNIDLEIKEGELLCILGYSGSGKTTLLNILAGIDRPTTGTCVISDTNTAEMSDQELNNFRREKIGYIFQNYALLPNLTASENIAITQNMNKKTIFKDKLKVFFAKFKDSKNGKERLVNVYELLRDIFVNPNKNTELEALMESLNLYEHKDKYPHQLSGGQQQRVAITRALIKKPKILLADEPTGAIDHAMTKSILEIFYNINEYAKTTVIMITHNPLIAKMAKRVIHVSNGMIVSDETNQRPQRPSEIEDL